MIAIVVLLHTPKGHGWQKCIKQVLLPHSPCRFTTANAPANGTFRVTDMPNAHKLGS